MGNVVVRDPRGNVVSVDGKPVDPDNRESAADTHRVIVGSPHHMYGKPSPQFAPSPWEVESLRSRAQEAERTIERMRQAPSIVGVVVEIRPDTKRVVVGLGPGGVFEVGPFAGAKVGHRVLLVRDTLQVLSSSEPDSATGGNAGSVVVVDEIGDAFITAKFGTETRVFAYGLHEKTKVGNRVVIDPSMSYVIGDLGPPPSPLSYTPKIRVLWDEIGGQAEAKLALQDAIELPAKCPELFKGYGKTPSKGVLMFGPPGTGKTKLAKASATSLAQVAGETHASGFVYIRGPELLNGWVGKTEQAIREVFIGAREHRAKHGYPCVVFIDECEALLKRRQGGQFYDFAQTVVPQFLAEMDGMDEAAALFILATNRIELIDPAVLRGRVDRRVYVGRPNREDVEQIAGIALRDVPCKDAAPEALASYLWDDARVVSTIHHPQTGQELTLRLRDLASGALVVGIVDQATTIAVRRDARAKNKAPKGLRESDIAEAIDLKLRELVRQDHREAFSELLSSGSSASGLTNP